jgi:hypothetical protein
MIALSASNSEPPVSLPWLCDHADADALTIAFGERAGRCLRGSSKHRRILSLSKVGTAESGAWLRVSPEGQ